MPPGSIFDLGESVMSMARLPIGVASLLLLAFCASASAQTNTSEGGGSSEEEREMLGDIWARLRTLEALQAASAGREIQNIKDQLRQVQMIEETRRKLAGLEKRIRALEAHGNYGLANDAAAGETPAEEPQQSGGQQPQGQSIGDLSPPQAPPGASSSKDASWRYRRVQGRWWYWTPNGQWLSWTGSRWVKSSPPARTAP